MAGNPTVARKAARKQWPPPSSTSGADKQVNTRPKSIAAKTSKKVTFRVPSGSSDEGEALAKSRQSQPRVDAAEQADVHPMRVNKKSGQNGRASIRHPRDHLNNRFSRMVEHFSMLSAERVVWSGRHSYREFVQDGAVRKSVSRIASGRSRQGQGKPDLVESRLQLTEVRSYLSGGRIISPGMDTSSGTDSLSEPESPIENIPRPRSDGPFKAARKLQLGVKSNRQRSAALIDEAESPDTMDQAEEYDSTVYDDSTHESAAYDTQHDEMTERTPDRTTPRLPFLLRNLRAGFKSRCTLVGIDPHKKQLPLRPISMSYPHHLGSIEEQQKTRNSVIEKQVNSWICPLCELHGEFNNRAILDMHLRWDHLEVKATWDATNSTLSLVIPVLEKTTAVPVKVEPRPASTVGGVGRKTARPQEIEKPPIRISSSPSTAVSESSPTPAVTPVVEDTKPKIEPASDRIPCAVEAFGPSAAFPYLPESADGSMYSCRPGGPRIYDLLNTLPLEPFGVLSWLIIDREEELFELDDILDEDKVMLALWNRWIFLNRNKFVANYFNGTKAFIKENWKMIQQAAGLSALRTWLLILCVNNFLPPLEVVSIIQFYQTLTSNKPA